MATTAGRAEKRGMMVHFADGVGDLRIIFFYWACGGDVMERDVLVLFFVVFDFWEAEEAIILFVGLRKRRLPGHNFCARLRS
jgi:hypothetical protein